MAPLLDPHKTAMVAFIDSLVSEYLSSKQDRFDEYFKRSAIFMIAEAASVPLVLVSDNSEVSASEDSLAAGIVRGQKRQAKPWETTRLGHELSQIGRSMLLFADSRISDPLCVTALSAYASGYEVYCTTFTGVPPRTPQEALICQRLQHTGIVVIAMTQVLAEWTAHVEDDEVRRTLLELQSTIE